jgi:hypothetical protein
VTRVVISSSLAFQFAGAAQDTLSGLCLTGVDPPLVPAGLEFPTALVPNLHALSDASAHSFQGSLYHTPTSPVSVFPYMPTSGPSSETHRQHGAHQSPLLASPLSTLIYLPAIDIRSGPSGVPSGTIAAAERPNGVFSKAAATVLSVNSPNSRSPWGSSITLLAAMDEEAITTRCMSPRVTSSSPMSALAVDDNGWLALGPTARPSSPAVHIHAEQTTHEASVFGDTPDPVSAMPDSRNAESVAGIEEAVGALYSSFAECEVPAARSRSHSPELVVQLCPPTPELPRIHNGD